VKRKSAPPSDFDAEDSVEMTAERVKLDASESIEMTVQRPKLEDKHADVDPLANLELSDPEAEAYPDDDDDEPDAGETIQRDAMPTEEQEDLRSTDKKAPDSLGDVESAEIVHHEMPADMYTPVPPEEVILTDREPSLHDDLEPEPLDEPPPTTPRPTPTPTRSKRITGNIIRRPGAPSVPLGSGMISRTPLPAIASGSQQVRDLARGSHPERQISPIDSSPIEPEVTFKRPAIKEAPPARDLPPGASFSDLEPTNIAPEVLAPEIEDRPTTNLDPGERGLIAAILAGNEASRLVYADWLQRHGEAARAEYMRVEHDMHEMPPDDIRHAEAAERLQFLATRISIDWRSRVSRSPIEGCNVGPACPGSWNALPTPEGGDDVRTCMTCQHEVFYCATVELAQIRARKRERVAVDVTCIRYPGDLGESCIQCQSFVPPDARFCPHCGQSMQRVMMQ
jgi:uncharacterized protein (TIGR02996 family)